MTFDDAFAAISQPSPALPEAAIRWLDENWPTCGLAIVTACEDFLNGEETPLSEQAFFFALHLAAAHGAKRLHAPLCALLLDADGSDELLGDAITETLPGLLISTFDGDLAPMRAVIETPNSDASAACHALLALAYLTHAGQVSRASTEAYLRRLFATIPRDPDYLWTGFAETVAALALDPLVPHVETLFAEGSIARDIMRLADFRGDLAEVKASGSPQAVFDNFLVRPLTDVVATLANWHSFDARPQRHAGTIINPMKDVGRNDPCPCGSGKKFKKCCLQAA